MLMHPIARGLAGVAAALFFAAAQPAAASDRGVEIVDYGIYDHSVTAVVPEPKDVAGERTTVANVRLREKTEIIDAQKSRMFGFQFRVTDPALVGRTLTLRRIVPPLTNPATGETATRIERDVVITHDNQLVLNAYRFDHGWEMAEGLWRFQVVLDGEVIAEKAIKVIIPMN